MAALPIRLYDNFVYSHQADTDPANCKGNEDTENTGYLVNMHWATKFSYRN